MLNSKEDTFFQSIKYLMVVWIYINFSLLHTPHQSIRIILVNLHNFSLICLMFDESLPFSSLSLCFIIVHYANLWLLVINAERCKVKWFNRVGHSAMLENIVMAKF